MSRFLLFCLLLAASPLHALEAIHVADDVYAFIGERGEISSANAGNIGNSGFIVGPSAVIVIDSGASYRHGKQMIAAIRQVTDKPISTLVITHAVQEFVFGNAAFAELGTSIVAHAKTAELMRQRCRHCLENLVQQLGEPAMAGTRLVIPERTIERSMAMRVGERDLELTYLGWASTPGDLAVYDRASGVLFAGGLVSNQRIPELRDGNLAGWLHALEALKRTPARVIVPGHGPVGGPELIDLTAAYLRALDEQVQRMYKLGASLTDTVDNVPLPAFADWAMYPATHRQNALHRYLQLEVDELGG